MEALAQNTSDSNNSLARTESKTACAEAGIRAASKCSSMIRRMSISLGPGFEVTKLPQTKTRRSSPPVAASSSSVRKRPDSHARLGDELQKRDWNSCQSIRDVHAGRQLSFGGQLGQHHHTITDGSDDECRRFGPGTRQTPFQCIVQPACCRRIELIRQRLKQLRSEVRNAEKNDS